MKKSERECETIRKNGGSEGKWRDRFQQQKERWKGERGRKTWAQGEFVAIRKSVKENKMKSKLLRE